MGQILDKFQGKRWRQKQILKITDKVYDYFKNESGQANLTFEDLYIAVLLVFKDMIFFLQITHDILSTNNNVYIIVISISGCLAHILTPHLKEKVKVLIQDCDINLDGELNHEEFVKLIEQITADTLITVSQGLIITLAVAPTIALLTKKSTEGIPHVGKVVQKVPSSVYASLVTLAIMMFQKLTRTIK